MKKSVVATAFGLTVLIGVVDVSYALDYTRMYGGAWNKGSLVQGVHSSITTPNDTPYINNSDNLNKSMSLDWAGVEGGLSDGRRWWVQSGILYGYDAEDTNDANTFNNIAKVYIEYGDWSPASSNLQEKVVGYQPFNTTWDYWIRYDTQFSAWKVNVNNQYVTYVYPFGPKTGTTNLIAEINVASNGNGPTRFSSNQYQDLGGTWRSFDTANYELKSDYNSGYIIPSTGTVSAFSIYK